MCESVTGRGRDNLGLPHPLQKMFIHSWVSNKWAKRKQKFETGTVKSLFLDMRKCQDDANKFQGQMESTIKIWGSSGGLLVTYCHLTN